MPEMTAKNSHGTSTPNAPRTTPARTPSASMKTATRPIVESNSLTEARRRSPAQADSKIRSAADSRFPR